MLKIRFANPNTSAYQLYYAVYMMAASLFKKCTCRNRSFENRLFLYYKELDAHQAIRLEEQVLKFTDGNLLPMLESMGFVPEFLKVTCDFIPTAKGMKIIFKTDCLELHLVPYADQTSRSLIHLDVMVVDHVGKRVVSDSLSYH